MAATAPSAPPARLLTFRSGGWVLVLAVVLVLGIAAWHITAILGGLDQPAIGDGRTVESYGFDLSNLTVDRALLVAAGFPKDGLPPMVAPAPVAADAIPELNRELGRQHVGKAVAGNELVLAVRIGDAARAYPLRILLAHEVVNDTLAGVPLLVTYHPLCGSAIVFERTLDGEVIEFGVSGLLYNSNLLMYDRRAEPAQESLWSQLAARAVSGPRAGTPLRIMPSAVLMWSEWLAQAPHSDVLLPDPARLPRYKRITYGPYASLGRIQFPVAPLPPADGPANMTEVLAVQLDGAWHHWTLPEVAAAADADGRWTQSLGGRTVTLRSTSVPAAAWLESPADAPSLRAYWFAYHALRR